MWNGEDAEETIRERTLKAGKLPRGKPRRKILRWLEENEEQLIICWEDATSARQEPDFIGEC